jgi:cobalt-zinc-cadmium efflux system protein
VVRETRLWIVLTLNLVLVVGLVAVGFAAHSLAVLAAGGDYIADAAAIGVSLLAIALTRRPPTPRRPQEAPKATAIAALVNGAFLLAVLTVVTVEAIRRLVTGTGHVHGVPVVIASTIAAAVVVLGAVILQSDAGSEDDDGGDTTNMRAVLLDTVADGHR